MQTAPTNWATYFANISHKKEYRVTISESDGTSPVTYGMDSIKAASIESGLLASDRWVGNCISRKLTISMLKTVTVPRMAKIKVEVRLALGTLYTDYVTIGAWWVDERESSSLWTNLICYDAMLITEQPFIDATLESGTWPITMTEAVTEICTRTGIALDARTTILTGTDYVVAYTNDLTMREVLENIAAAHGGNWTITPEGKLRLVVLASAGATPAIALGQSVKNFYSGDSLTISKVTLYDDAQNAFSAGDTTGYELSADCLYATTAIANALGTATTGTLYGVVYTPFEAANTYLNPLFELGDDLSVNGISSVIYTADITISSAYTADISCPYEQEVDHEYPYLSEIARVSNRTVKLNANYYGTTISRKSGIVIDKTDGETVSARAIFNSDTLALQALKDGALTNSVYFDAALGKFVFDGELSADVINALSALISPTVIVNNLYAEYGRIADLSVSELDTAWQKVENYLNSDTSDVRYQRIYEDRKELIIATISVFGDASSFTATAASESQIDLTWSNPSSFGVEQFKDRDANNLYWIDETHSGMTTAVTDYPVYIYAYDEITKRVDGTEVVDGAYSPYTIEGAGDGVTSESGKVKRQKKADGYYITYYKRTSGDPVEIAMTDNGIADNNVGTTAERPSTPATGQHWLDTTLGLPIWYDGANWINASGATV